MAPATPVRVHLGHGRDALPEALARLPSGQITATTEPPPSSGWYLAVDDSGLALFEGAGCSRFAPAAAPLRRTPRRDAIARACGARPGLVVFDAMAGWGSDGLTLAAAGCSVTMAESHPAVFAVLVDRVSRSGWEVAVELVDAHTRIPAGFDVVYLDPMFEPRTKNALPKKPMQVLREIVGRDAPDVAQTLALARRHARDRVVLKRRVHATPIASPDWCVRGRTVRFDVYRPLESALSGPELD